MSDSKVKKEEVEGIKIVSSLEAISFRIGSTEPTRRERIERGEFFSSAEPLSV